MESKLSIKGELNLKLVGPDGQIKFDKTVPNLVVTSGTTYTASRMVDASAGVMSHMAVGTSGTAPIIANTTLGGEVSRVALTSAVPTGSTITYTGIFGPGVGTGTLQEAGILNAAGGGTMLSRTTYTSVNKGAGDTLTITWTITVG